MNLQDTINELFATHPNVDVFYKTSDDQFFFEKPNADAHGMSLSNKGVATVTRAQAVLPVAAPGGDPTINNPEATQPTAEQLAEKAAADAAAQQALEAELAAKAKEEEVAAVLIEQQKAEAEAAQKISDDQAAQDALTAELNKETSAAVVADGTAADSKIKTPKNTNPAGL